MFKHFPRYILGIGLAVFSAFLIGKYGLVGLIVLIGLMSFLVIAYATFRDPRIGLFIVTFLLPFERVGSIDIAGFTLRSSQAIGALTIFVWVIWLIVNRPRKMYSNPTFWVTVLFLLIALLSVTQAVNTFRSVTVWSFVAFTVFVSWLVPQLINNKQHLQTLIRILFITSFLVGMFGLFQFAGDLVGLPPSLTGLREQYTSEVFGFPRVQSTFLEPLYYANFLLIPICLAISFLLSKKKQFPSWLLLGLILLWGVNFVLTLSRGAFIALSVSLLLLAIIYWRKVVTPHRLILGLLAVLIIGWSSIQFLGLTGDSQESLDTFTRQATGVFTGASYFDRAETFGQAWEMFQTHPWLGVGIGNFGPNIAPLELVQPDAGWLIVNNEFLEILAEIGLLGFLAYLTMLVFLLFRSIKAIRITTDPYLKAVMIGLLAAFIGIIVQYQTFSILFIMHIWFLFGLMVAVQNIIITNSE
ncbi:MAG: O-antigen ligase family protein [bacterium]